LGANEAGSGPAADGGGDGSTPDRGPDVSTPNSGPDASTPDSGPDGSTPDSGPDGSTPDRGPDVSTPDRGPDVSTPNSGPDASTPNSGPDVSTPNSGPDGGTPDSGLDGSGRLHVVRGQNGQLGHLVDGSGHNVQLRGVDRFGTETDCNTFNKAGGGPQGPFDQSDIDAIKAWKANAVRVPLNEGCWLGTQNQPNYRKSVEDWVDLITANQLIAIVDLHWSTPSTQSSQAAMSNSPGQQAMADAYNSIDFWKGIATTFAKNGNVIFDLYNEPNVSDWTCWLVGGNNCGGANFDVAGMAQMLKAVRSAGASNVVIMGGVSYAGDITKWQEAVEKIPTLPAPNDGLTLDNIAASVHVYDFNSVWSGCPSQFNGYATTCYSAKTTADKQGISPVIAAGYPVIVGETGISVFSSDPAPYSSAQAQELATWFDNMLTWLDQNEQSYVAWSWNNDGAPHLLNDYSGTPSPTFGVTYQGHLAKF
jgi:hypothetical protein